MKIFDYIKKTIYSGNNIVNLSDVRYLPRWVILLIDILLVSLAIFISHLIVSEFNYNVFNGGYGLVGLILCVNIVFMYVYKTYAGVIRHSTFVDLLKILFAIVSSSVVILIIDVAFYWIAGKNIIYRALAYTLLLGAISAILLFSFRLVVKEVFHIAREFRRSHLKKRILILGTGEQSISIARAIIGNPDLPYYVDGFLTKRNDTKRASILGKRIVLSSDFEKQPIEKLDIDAVLVIKEIMDREELNEWVNLLLEKKVSILKSPSIQKLRSNDKLPSIRTLQIEDLLNRKPIKIENEEVKSRLFGNAVLVTGGAGSIGSEIVRQVAHYKPEILVVLDQAETPLYEIELEIKKDFPEVNTKFILADITNKDRLEALFQEYHFSMVYHAAAYKHVPLVEDNPNEGTLVNVLGSKNLALLSSKYGVNRFVMVSTDKAVNPTNVMGATKRTAELFVQALQGVEGNTTKFITTRFGNVLGSNGSVIPHFKKQIEAGGPVTITHPEITRYFMTIPEACELVLTAGIMGNGGEIYVFDMGEPVKIVDLAHRMIKLSGYQPNVDIKIVYSGLRPGEKLYEELLSDDTKNLPTSHEKIMISKDPTMPFEAINTMTEELEECAKNHDKIQVVKKIKQIVREFKSNNSIYEILD